MGHNTRLRASGTSTRACVDRIVKVYERATESQREAGAQWYLEGEAFVRNLAAATDLHPARVAAVVAHLSPRTTWARNTVGATMLITKNVAPGCIGANIARATGALLADAPLLTLNGPKTRRFAANLLGDYSVVTVDVWAARVAFGKNLEDPEKMLGRAGIYDAIEHAYQLAAIRLGVSPTTVQATTWIVARNGRSA